MYVIWSSGESQRSSGLTAIGLSEAGRGRVSDTAGSVYIDSKRSMVYSIG